MSNLRVGLIRTGFRMAGRFAPSLTARAAGVLFRLPPRRRTSDWESRLLATGRRRSLRTAAGQLATWSWGEGPPVLLVHGWGSRGARLGSFVEPIVAAGSCAVAFDAPGHGASAGRLSSLPQFVEAVLAVSRQRGPLSGVVAHSMGGAAVALAIGRGLAVARAVFVAPAANPGDYSRRFAQMLSIPVGVRETMERRFEKEFGFRWEEFDVIPAVASLTTPLLVFHDREDREVPWSEGDAIARAWPGARLVTTQGLGHKRIVHDPQVVSQAVAFLAEGGQLRRGPAHGEQAQADSGLAAAD